VSVPLNAVVTVNFSEAMETGSVNSETLALFQGATAVTGTTSCSGAKGMFKPGADLEKNTDYVVRVTTGVRDISGNAMVAPYIYSFMTGSTVSAGTFTVTPSAGTHGTITPALARAVASHATPTFTITADAGYHTVTPVGGTCGGALSGSTYATNAVMADCTVAATFVADTAATHTVTASAGANGSISPSGAVSVDHGATRGFTVTAAANYHVVTPVGGTCGGSLSGSAYTTSAVTADCTVTASFAANTPVAHTVTASAGGNGSISPSGAVSVNHGATQGFTITAAPNYHVVTPVGGTCGGSLSGSAYTTTAVMADCAVAASFAANAPVTHTITASAGDHGTIWKSGKVTVDHGSTATFTIAPAKGYRTVTPVGGTCGGSLSGNSYTTNAVNADCTVSPTFTRITAAVMPRAGARGTLVPSGLRTVRFKKKGSFAFNAAMARPAGLFAAAGHTVTPAPTENGRISPADVQRVALNRRVSFTLTPAAGYALASVSGCGGTLAGNVYTTAPVTVDCTVTATFVQSLAI
jgi:hypothetical protein